ncbi:hemolysin XhlA family protein [Secundilactobacillus collinoides]|uniref:Holin n=1 Tax=Secundilactobacillus collinoides TaxID=33960 RepID=A0A166GDK8_SECCO|nr:hemolysin XhlA family protein [Secundilactobacillus collinoides]KZL38737.1 holin [Secundilactobacillus collinoides]
MAELDDTTKLLIGIQKDVIATKTKVEDIEVKLDQVDRTENNAKKALAKAIETEHRVDQVTYIQNWLIGLLVSGGLLALLIYIAEKFL